MAEVSLPYTTGLTFEKVWAMFQETDKKFKETDRMFKETDKQFQEMREQSKERFKELGEKIAETDKIVKNVGKQIGDLGNRFGEVAEHMVAPGVVARFNEIGYHFNSCASGGVKINDDNGKTLTEIDILLENIKTFAVVEVKAKPVLADIDHHLKRIKIFQQHIKKARNQKAIIGAIAGAVFSKSVKDAVIAAGFYAITPSGDTVKIDVPEGFKPRKF
jgi:hypothetical protein